MPDYGHDVRLAAYLIRQSRRTLNVVALAQLSEQAGLELWACRTIRTSPSFTRLEFG